MARAQHSILTQNLKPQICWANIDNKVELGFPVLLLQLPELSILQFHVVPCQVVADQCNLSATRACGQQRQLVDWKRRHHNLRLPDVLVIALCKCGSVEPRNAILDADFPALLDEPTMEISTLDSSNVMGRQTRPQFPPIDDC